MTTATELRAEVVAELGPRLDEYAVDAIVREAAAAGYRTLWDVPDWPGLVDRHRITWELRGADDTATQVWSGGRHLGDVQREAVRRGGYVWRVIPLSRVSHAGTAGLPIASTRDAAARILALGRYAL